MATLFRNVFYFNNFKKKSFETHTVTCRLVKYRTVSFSISILLNYSILFGNPAQKSIFTFRLYNILQFNKYFLLFFL